MDQLPRLKIYPPGHYVELDGEALYLGRDCHLAALIPTLLNKVVSNRHCVVRRDGTRWMLEDLGSTNGTWIHGQRLAGKKTLLHTGDEFRLGKQGPLVTCDSGFGGTGPDRTTPEDEMPGAAQVDTLVEEPRPQPRKPAAAPPRGGPPAPPARTPDGRDGSAVLPFRVGRTPSLRLVHQRSGEQFAATGYTIVIGRIPAAQVVIRADDERHVSGRHVEIQFRTDHTVVVRDLGSRNGSWLNDKPLKGEAPLRLGDRILLGNAPTVLTVLALDG